MVENGFSVISEYFTRTIARTNQSCLRQTILIGLKILKRVLKRNLREIEGHPFTATQACHASPRLYFSINLIIHQGFSVISHFTPESNQRGR